MRTREPERAGTGDTCPRVLSIDLARATPAATGGGSTLVARCDERVRPWSSEQSVIDHIGSWSGSALALAILYARERAQPGAEAPLVLAVGECLRRGLPTAARACIAGRAPLSGLYADGQVGSDLARRLAITTDALVLSGRTQVRAAVLRIRPGAAPELHSFPELEGSSPRECGVLLGQRFPDAALLRIGPAGESGADFASLAAGGDPPSFVGRGGLGAVFGRLGLKALVVEGEDDTAAADDVHTQELIERLLSSPRLDARALGGTLELFDAHAARGDLRGANYAQPLAPESAAGFAPDPRQSASERRGCKGCPTPCGWVFERGQGERRGARFNALYALGPNLGLDDFDQALELLADCDALGVDAKEVGALLALAATARERGLLPGPALFGDAAGLRAMLRALVLDEDYAEAQRGAERFAAQLGLTDSVTSVRGQAARREANLAALLGQCVSQRGADPMRSFPFLSEGVPRERLAQLLHPLSLPPGAEDPADASGKGRVVYWHENLMAALDMSGFCAFSSAGLLSDGVCSLEELARWIAPRALLLGDERLGVDAVGASGAARRLLAAGATLVSLQRELNRLWGASASSDRPQWAAAELDRPGMLAEYQALRGISVGDAGGADVPGSGGAQTSLALEHLGRETILDLVSLPCTSSEREPGVLPEPASDVRRAQLHLNCFGPLADVLGREAVFELDLPAPLGEVLATLAERRPQGARLLVRAGQPVPAVYRAGRRLAPEELVCAGDRLDLVLAIAGGRAPAG